MALPTSLAYVQRPSAVASRSTRSSIAPVNGSTFSGTNGQTIRLEIPTGITGQYLNPAQSYLKFSVKTSRAVRCDKSIYSIFDRLVISHNGIVLEQVDQYGLLANALLDFQCSNSQLDNDLNVMLGTASTANNGDTSNGLAIEANIDVWFNMPLLSSLFTMLGDKYVPIGDARHEIRIELTLHPQGFIKSAADVAAGGTYPGYTYEVSNVEMLLDVIELDPAVSAEIRKETLSREGAFKIPVSQWRNLNSVIPSGQASANIIIPAKMNSLKNLLVLQRDQANVTGIGLSKNERVGGGAKFKNYWFQIGSHMHPQKPVNHVFEAYAELQKSMHDLSLGNGDSVISRANFDGKRFMIGAELESLSHRSDVLNSGLNSTSLNIYFNPTFDGATTETRRVDTFAHYDALVLIDATGQMNVVF